MTFQFSFLDLYRNKNSISDLTSKWKYITEILVKIIQPNGDSKIFYWKLNYIQTKFFLKL